MSQRAPEEFRRRLERGSIRGLAVALLGLAACGKAAPIKATPPATVSNPPRESDLTTVTLTEKADQRLGIRSVAVARRNIPRTRAMGGEILVPPGQALTVSAPVAGTVLAVASTLPAAGSLVRRGQVVLRLYPLPASSDLTSAAVRLDSARKRAVRAEQLLKDEAGSQRAVEEAQAELALAEAQSAAVRPRAATGARKGALGVESPQNGVLRDVFVGPGQSVAAGAPLFQVEASSVLWVRVPIYVGDLGGVQVDKAVEVQPLGSAAAAGVHTAVPAAAPPSANPEAASTDLIFQLDNGAGLFRPGQRVRVALPLVGSEEALVVPWAAVIHDIHGGTWVYEVVGRRVYRRVRVEVKHLAGSNAEALAVLGRGPAPGRNVVAVGAAELFGTEFGTGK